MKTKKPLLTKKHKARRYSWAKKCKHATWLDWSYVVFLDESKFNLFGSNGGNIARGGVESVFWTNMFNPLSNLGGGVLWFGDA